MAFEYLNTDIPLKNGVHTMLRHLLLFMAVLAVANSQIYPCVPYRAIKTDMITNEYLAEYETTGLVQIMPNLPSLPGMVAVNLTANRFMIENCYAAWPYTPQSLGCYKGNVPMYVHPVTVGSTTSEINRLPCALGESGCQTYNFATDGFTPGCMIKGCNSSITFRTFYTTNMSVYCGDIDHVDCQRMVGLNKPTNFTGCTINWNLVGVVYPNPCIVPYAKPSLQFARKIANSEKASISNKPCLSNEVNCKFFDLTFARINKEPTCIIKQR